MAISILDRIAGILVIIGGINWGLVGIAKWNLVEVLLGVGTITDIVYGIVGVSAIYMIFAMMKMK